jgi:membrane protein YdbS with pleckstrin-like domain
MRVTDQATRVVSAGWYQDPASSAQVRWWNGVAWTEHVHAKPDAAHAVPETTEQRIASARELERQFGIGTSEIPVVASRASTPAATQAASAATAKRSAARASTAAAWMIAVSPVLALVLGIAAAYVYFYVLATPIVFLIAAAVPYLLCVLWALGDGRTLKDRGFNPPSAAFALLTGLGYLIVRRTRIPGSGPIAMLLVVTVLTFGSLPVASLMGQTQGLTNALKIQSTISADYLTHGKAVQVNCPPFVDAATVGTLYTCDATTATGVHRTIWVSIDGDNGKFSYSFGL